MHKLKMVLIVTFLFAGISIWGDVDAQRVSDAETLNEIMEDVDSLFNGRDRIEGYPKYKHFARWAYWWSSRVNPDGSFLDVQKLNEDAWAEIRSTQNNRNTTAYFEFWGPDVSTYANNGSHCKGNGYGRVDRISFHPTDPDKLYVSTPNGGAWFSDDGGITWECLTDNMLVHGCAGIIVDHSNTNRLFLLSGTPDNSTFSFVTLFGYRFPSDGIYRSDDHGSNWYKILEFDTLLSGNIIPANLKMSPHNADHIFATTDKGIVATFDGGNNWAVVNNFDSRDIEFHPTDDQRVYSTGYGVARYSDDAGETWNVASGAGGCPINRRWEIAVSADAPDQVTLLAPQRDTSLCGIYRSYNKGVSYNLLDNGTNVVEGQAGYNLGITVDPSNGDRVIVGALTGWRTHDIEQAAPTWTNIAPYWEATGSQQGTLPSNYVHPDVHDVKYNPLNGILYACSDGGVYVSGNNGNTWINRSQGIHTSQIYHMDVANADLSQLTIGLQDNGVKVWESFGSQDFLHINSGDGFEVISDPLDDDRIVASLNRVVYLYPDYNTSTRIKLDDDTISDQFFAPTAFKQDQNDTVFMGELPMRIIDISGNTASSIWFSSTATASASWEIESCPEDGDQVYIAGGSNSYQNDPNGSFWSSTDGGVTFTDRSGATGFPTTMTKITDIAIRPGGCAGVAFSMGGYEEDLKVFYSPGSGNSWVNRSYNLPNVPVHAVEIRSNGDMFAGTEIGIFWLEQGSTTWMPFYNRMPRVPVIDLKIGNNNQRLYAATFGRGVWEAFVPGDCSENLDVTETMDGPYFFEANTSITSTGEVEGGEGTDVRFQAGDFIKLEPGFKVTAHSKFNARIVPCGTDPDD